MEGAARNRPVDAIDDGRLRAIAKARPLDRNETILRPLGEKIAEPLVRLQRLKLIRSDLNLKSFLVILFESIWGYFAMHERTSAIATDTFLLPQDHEPLLQFMSDLYYRGIRA